MKKAAIIGFGRFGELLANLAKHAFDVYVVEPNPPRRVMAKTNGFKLLPFEAVAEAEFIFLAIPISQIESTILKLATVVSERHTVVDVCSVKVYPAQLMRKYLTKSQLLGLHPMFGPDSAKKGLQGLQVAWCPLRIDQAKAQIIRNFWSNLGLIVAETTPGQHDRDSVYSQAFTYSVARIVVNTPVPQIGFRTRNFDALAQVAKFSARDGEQLFHDMLFYNPYYQEMKKQLEAAIEVTKQRLNEIEAEQVTLQPF